MNIKLVADSSANVSDRVKMPVSYVPLKIVTQEKEYTDNASLDVRAMLAELKEYKGTSGTACPGIEDWLAAFDGADVVYGVSLTSALSGCYNSAMISAGEYLEEHSGAKVFILDSLTTGPELSLLLEKYEQMIEAGLSYEEICTGIVEYKKHTHLAFSLESLDNFVKNGRVNPLVGRAAGILGLCIVGRASTEGTLEPLHKVRGEKKAIVQLYRTLTDLGYAGGKVRISHSYNEAAANSLADMIKKDYPQADIDITLNRGICCYYAEEGGVLVGFEDRDA